MRNVYARATLIVMGLFVYLILSIQLYQTAMGVS